MEKIFTDAGIACRRLRIGVDFEAFYPLEESIERDGPLRIGWCGSRDKHGMKRGLEQYWEPAVRMAGCIPVLQLKEENLITNDHELREKFYRNIDLYLCTSITEGHPTGPLEAAACGVPTLSTDCGVMPELITHGKSGWLVRRRVNAITEALRAISVKGRDNLQTVGLAARKVMERDWNWSKNVHDWIKYFEDC